MIKIAQHQEYPIHLAARAKKGRLSRLYDDDVFSFELWSGKNRREFFITKESCSTFDEACEIAKNIFLNNWE